MARWVAERTKRERVEWNGEDTSVLTVWASDGLVRAQAEWGGWLWRGEGRDEQTAREHLLIRFQNRDPFKGDQAWGSFGFGSKHGFGEIDVDESIAGDIQSRMQQQHDRMMVEIAADRLIDRLLERQASKPWAFPPSGAEVPQGVEIEGYQLEDGRIAVLPTVYEILFVDVAQFVTESKPRSITVRLGEEMEVPPNAVGSTVEQLVDGFERLGVLTHALSEFPHQLRAIQMAVVNPAALDKP